MAKRWWHLDGSECAHKRCKRRARVRVICDRCRVNCFESSPAEMWEAAKMGGFILRVTGACFCGRCHRKVNDQVADQVYKPVQRELWPL